MTYITSDVSISATICQGIHSGHAAFLRSKHKCCVTGLNNVGCASGGAAVRLSDLRQKPHLREWARSADSSPAKGASGKLVVRSNDGGCAAGRRLSTLQVTASTYCSFPRSAWECIPMTGVTRECRITPHG